MGAEAFIKVVLKNFDVLAGPLITLVYPLCASVRAIETKTPIDDEQWLTYWVLYSLITLFDLTFAKVLKWLPFWSYIKLIGTCWLVLPYFSGAAYVYQHCVRPLFLSQKKLNIWYVQRKKNNLSNPDDVLRAAERYIAEYGSEAFQKLISKTGNVSKSRHSAGRSQSLFECRVERNQQCQSVTTKILILMMITYIELCYVLCWSRWAYYLTSGFKN